MLSLSFDDAKLPKLTLLDLTIILVFVTFLQIFSIYGLCNSR